MSPEKHPFDLAAEKLEAIANRPVAGQPASADFWELQEAADETVGDYPQVVYVDPPDWGDSEGLGPDGFPDVPIPEMQLQETAKRTDVLSNQLWSDGFLLNDKARAAFRRCDLGNVREYPAVVRDHDGTKLSLNYLHVRNVVEPGDVDFARSEFYVREMLGIPGPPVEVASFDDWQAKVKLAREGKLKGCEKFSGLDFKRLLFAAGRRPSVDLFRLARLASRTYITTKLRDAIVEAGITGVEIRENRRLFAS